VKPEEPDYRQTYRRFSPEQFAALLPILTKYTNSETGFYLYWYGFGDLNERTFNKSVPMVRHPIREFYLLKGPLGAFEEFPHPPSYWWPEDRAWCIAGDIDFEWVYLGGSMTCVNEALAIPVIDAVPTRPEDPAHDGMDTINEG
jgi:hypothetical protein